MTSMDQLALVLAVLGILGTVLTAGRTFFVVEERQHAMSKTVDKLSDDQAATAKEFNGPARAAHVELVGRVTSLESSLQKLATAESVENLAEKMDSGFKRLEQHLTTIERKDPR